MNPNDFAKPKASYRKLYVFQKAEAIYDLTYHFLQAHIAKSDRTYDQMLQAARSGKQNIVEGRSDAASSAEMEIKLFGVAKGSLPKADFLKNGGIKEQMYRARLNHRNNNSGNHEA